MKEIEGRFRDLAEIITAIFCQFHFIYI